MKPLNIISGMVEVFKTNVENQEQADFLIRHIQHIFSDYQASFDLEDCDNILCVKSGRGFVDISGVVHVLRRFGFSAEILPDEVVPSEPVLYN
jgi:hypothetical protein